MALRCSTAEVIHSRCGSHSDAIRAGRGRSRSVATSLAGFESAPGDAPGSVGHLTGRFWTELPPPRPPQPDPRPAQVPRDRLPAHPGRLLDAPQRPTEAPQRADLFLFLVLQDVGHPAGSELSSAGQRLQQPPTTGRFSGGHDWPLLGGHRGERMKRSTTQMLPCLPTAPQRMRNPRRRHQGTKPPRNSLPLSVRTWRGSPLRVSQVRTLRGVDGMKEQPGSVTHANPTGRIARPLPIAGSDDSAPNAVL